VLAGTESLRKVIDAVKATATIRKRCIELKTHPYSFRKKILARARG